MTAIAPPEAATELVQKLYKEPVKEGLIEKRVKEMKKGGVAAAVSCIPTNAEKFAPIAQEAGADLFFVEAPQSVEELEQTPRRVRGPCLINMVGALARRPRTERE